MTQRLTGPALVAYLRDNPTSDAMRAAADEIVSLLAERDALIHDNSEYVSAANELATENQRLREALEASIEQMEYDAAKIDGEWGDCRSIDELERDGELPAALVLARAALAQEQGGSDA